MKLIRGAFFVFLSLIGCVFLVTDFSDNLQAAYHEEDEAAQEPHAYTWDDFKTALGFDFGDKKITELTLADFTAQQQEELGPFLEGKPIQEWIDGFCSRYGTEDYYAMAANIEDANPDQNLLPLLKLWETIAVNFCE